MVVLYLPGLSGPFMFDDGSALTRNPHLQIDPKVADEWRTITADIGKETVLNSYRRSIGLSERQNR